MLMTLYKGNEFEIVKNTGLPNDYSMEICEQNTARVFNKALYDDAKSMNFTRLIAALSGCHIPKNYYSTEEIMRRDYYIILATKT